ncbi:ataxin-3 [Aplysia californica]|uniref:ubiquitinyl hydrolase 1 n=1 Tax=Aplysia californica TaxID=6500 RepID=A0ABM0JT89_APLCA|nr:ataxin-3 [Aplysia californica]
MESIFHEKQEGSLCAQHCLNALLQNQYFSAVDLAQIGTRLDERERDRMAEGGVATNEYQRFIEQPSNNYDDSGFFSVQVISEALSVWSLDMVLYNSQNPVAVQAREDPTQMTAFICNYHQHWFCVRKLGEQWFNLNSLLSGPELISSTYLALFLTQLQQEGYSIFIITGSLPSCEADQLLRLMPAVQTVKPRLLTEKEGGIDGAEGAEDDEDDALKEALRVSKEMIEHDDSALQQALQMSLEGYHMVPTFSNISSPQTNSANKAKPSGSADSEPASCSRDVQPSPEELRQKRLAFLERQQAGGVEPVRGSSEGESTDKSENSSAGTEQSGEELSEEELLQRAIAMSMEQS